MIHGAIHAFTDRPELAAKAFYRELEATLRERISLERELGIFLGSTPLEDFLAACTKVKETEFATVCKSDRLG